ACGRSDEAAGGGPAGEFVAVGELEFAEHGRDVGLHCLDGDEQLLGDLLVRVAAGDQPQHLALALRQRVELRVDGGRLGGGEGVEDEPGQAGREDRVALRDPADGVGQLLTADVIVDVAEGAATDDSGTIHGHYRHS